MAIVGVLETQVRASTQNFDAGMERAGRKASEFERNVANAAQKAARGFGAAMSAVAASSAAAEKNWVTLGATIVGSFATGGPVIGAITAAAAAVGLFISKSKEAPDEWAKATERIRADARKVADELQEMQKRLFVLGGGTGTQFRIDVIDKRIADLRTLLVPSAIFGDEAPVDQSGVLGAIKALEQERKNLVMLAELEAEAQRMTAEQAEREAIAKRSIAGLSGPWTDLKMPGRLGSVMFRSRAEAVGLPPDVPFADLRGTDLLPFPDDRQERWDAARADDDAREKAAKKLAEDFKRAMELVQAEATARAERIAAPFHDAFADAIVDGARTGFKNLKDIVNNLFASWLGMAARGFSERAFGGVFQSLFGGAGGGTTIMQQIIPVAVSGDVIAQGIGGSPQLQTIVNTVGSDVRTLEQYRGN